uniref:PWWP domain-containing protein n=1 Tax=Strongyloides venezuelensis TaxID=75913 RepID=A0A0K0FXI4_STRVS
MSKVVDKGSGEYSAKIAGNLAPGDVGMVLYKKKVWWPCVIRMIYSKKVSYNYLPIKENNKGVFTAPFKNLRLFDINEKVPNDATEELLEALEEAKKLYMKKCDNKVSHTKVNENKICVNTQKENHASKEVANIVNISKVVIQQVSSKGSPVKSISKDSKAIFTIPFEKNISSSPPKIGRVVVKRSYNDSKPKVDSGKKDDKQNLIDLLLSDRTKVNFTDILTGKRLSKRHLSFRPTKMLNSLKFDPYTESFIPFESLEKVVAEYKNWMKMSEDLSTYGPLTELYYIQTVLIPESIVFSLSILNHTSVEEAEHVFKNVNKEVNTMNVPKIEDSTGMLLRSLPKQSSNNAIDTLLIAAEMLQG